MASTLNEYVVLLASPLKSMLLTLPPIVFPLANTSSASVSPHSTLYPTTSPSFSAGSCQATATKLCLMLLNTIGITGGPSASAGAASGLSWLPAGGSRASPARRRSAQQARGRRRPIGGPPPGYRSMAPSTTMAAGAGREVVLGGFAEARSGRAAPPPPRG